MAHICLGDGVTAVWWRTEMKVGAQDESLARLPRPPGRHFPMLDHCRAQVLFQDRRNQIGTNQRCKYLNFNISPPPKKVLSSNWI